MPVLLIFAIVWIVGNLLKGALEKPAPKGQRFDWDAYWKDVESGVDSMEQVRKRQRGDYLTTDPLPNSKVRASEDKPCLNGEEQKRRDEQAELEAQRKKLEEAKQRYEVEHQQRKEEKARAEAERKRQQEEKNRIEQQHINKLRNQCISILRDAGFSSIKVSLQKYGAIEMVGFRNDMEHKLSFHAPLQYKKIPDDAAVIILARSLCEIDLSDRNNREIQIWEFYNKHGCSIQEIRGISGNDPSVSLQGLCSFDTVFYHFDIDEYERKVLLNKPKVPVTKFIEKCKATLTSIGFSDVEVTVGENNDCINISNLRKGIKYGYQCEFTPAQNAGSFSLTENVAQEIVFNCLSAMEEISICRKTNVEKTLRTFFEKNHYSCLNVISKNNAFHIFATKYNLKCNMKFFYEAQTCTYEDCIASAVSVEPFDSMDGFQFEKFCAEIIEKNGYENVSVTSGSGDQGVDIIAYRDGIKYGIQCKCYASPIGNKAVQEVFAGKTFYRCHVGIVLTNNYFTPAAVELAQSNGIILWNRDKLLQMIENANTLATQNT